MTLEEDLLELIDRASHYGETPTSSSFRAMLEQFLSALDPEITVAELRAELDKP